MKEHLIVILSYTVLKIEKYQVYTVISIPDQSCLTTANFDDLNYGLNL